MGNKIYFISDLHLGASYMPDTRALEQRIVRFLESISEDAAELYMLGDILDYWYEYRTVVPRGYVRFFGALAKLVDKGVKVTWFIGNHDIWLFDYIRDEIGVRIVDGTETRTVGGKNFLLGHGDGVGKLPFGFRFIRTMFRNRVCQKLYAAIHPRWTIPFALRWSNHSRQSDKCEPKFEGEENEPIIKFCKDHIKSSGIHIDYYVFGHRHILLDFPVNNGESRVIILGDWINHFSYGVFDGKELTLKHFCDL